MAESAENTKARSKGWGLGIVLLIVIGLSIALSMQPSAVSVETATVSNRSLQITVNEQGRTRAQEPFTVSAPFYG